MAWMIPVVKKFLGDKQLEWLVNSLLYSKASFKFLVFGSQVLNPLNEFEGFRFYKRNMTPCWIWLKKIKFPESSFERRPSYIGDHQSATRRNVYFVRCNKFSFYFTQLCKICRNKRIQNPYRVVPVAVTEQNFIKVTISGERNNRSANIAAINADNKLVWQYEINQQELKWKWGLLKRGKYQSWSDISWISSSQFRLSCCEILSWNKPFMLIGNVVSNCLFLKQSTWKRLFLRDANDRRRMVYTA